MSEFKQYRRKQIAEIREFRSRGDAFGSRFNQPYGQGRWVT